MPYKDQQEFQYDIQQMEVVYPFSYTGWAANITRYTVDALAILATPSTPVVCDKSTLGSMNSKVQNGSPLTPYFIRANLTNLDNSSGVRIPDLNYALIVDRLTHQAGIATNSIGTFTTNLPTAALTRHTSGSGVLIGITSYATVSPSPVLTLSYTNQSNVSGRTSSAMTLSNTYPGNFYMVGLQSGDTGVRSVESVSVTTASSTAGNIGICLFKPVCAFGIPQRALYDFDFVSGGMLGGIANFLDDSCLAPILGSRSTGSSADAYATGILGVGFR